MALERPWTKGAKGVKVDVELYQLIRYKYAVERLSKRRIARELGISRHTVDKYCEGAAVPWERKRPERKAPVMTEAVVSFIEECLRQDQKAPKKQRHTAHRIYERLREEMGFQGAEPTVRRQVAILRQKLPEAYVPLGFGPGEAAQVDWGRAVVVMGGVRREVELLCFRLCYSCAPFVVAFPCQREEAFLEGHILAFAYFGGVPEVCIYDNVKTAVKSGFGRHAEERGEFLAFRAHYAFKAEFCNPGEAHEKGLVENLVGWARRNILVPLPEVEDFAALNRLLRRRCEEYLSHTVRGRETSVGEALQCERNRLTPLPAKPYDPARAHETVPNYFALVTFDGNQYSVPVELVGRTVTVKAYADSVKIYHRGMVVAFHRRLYGKGKTAYELSHYLRLLERKPRAVFHAKPVREANLPGIYEEFARLSDSPERTMVRLLRLGVDYGLERVATAIEEAMAIGARSVEVVAHYLAKNEESPRLPVRGPRVDPPDLGRYDLLLGGGTR